MICIFYHSNHRIILISAFIVIYSLKVKQRKIMKLLFLILISFVALNSHAFEKKCFEYEGFVEVSSWDIETEEPDSWTYNNYICAHVQENKLTNFSIQPEDDTDRVTYLPGGGTSTLNGANQTNLAVNRIVKNKTARKICQIFGFKSLKARNSFEIADLSWNPGGVTINGNYTDSFNKLK